MKQFSLWHVRINRDGLPTYKINEDQPPAKEKHNEATSACTTRNGMRDARSCRGTGGRQGRHGCTQPAGIKPAVTTLEFGGKYTCTLDTTEAPDLTTWANAKIAPVVKEWYPKIVEMLPSDGYEAPTKFSITFTPKYKGVAATSGTKIVGSLPFFTAHPDDVGAIVHEMVHVVQQYGRARRANPDAQRPPGWLVEGIPDYLRWYKFEPQSHGADIKRTALVKARFDGSYPSPPTS